MHSPINHHRSIWVDNLEIIVCDFRKKDGMEIKTYISHKNQETVTASNMISQRKKQALDRKADIWKMSRESTSWKENWKGKVRGRKGWRQVWYYRNPTRIVLKTTTFEKPHEITEKESLDIATKKAVPGKVRMPDSSKMRSKWYCEVLLVKDYKKFWSFAHYQKYNALHLAHIVA